VDLSWSIAEQRYPTAHQQTRQCYFGIITISKKYYIAMQDRPGGGLRENRVLRAGHSRYPRQNLYHIL
jgi:hypothetical protein